MALHKRRFVESKTKSSKPIWLFLLLIIGALAASYFIVFYSGFQVNKITISGNDRISTKDIESLIEKDVNKKILSIEGPFGLWKINSKSIFLVNPDKLGTKLLKEFPVIENIKVIRNFMQTIEVDIKERVPAAILCWDDSVKENCYFVDKNGIIFEPLYVMPQNMVIVRQSTSIEQVLVGEEVIHKNIMDLILEVEKNLKDNFQINLKEALVTSPVRLNVKTSENWKIYFDINPEPDESSQVTKLNLLLTTGLTPEQRKNLRYVDLRPKDKAIVCDNNTCGAGQ